MPYGTLLWRTNCDERKKTRFAVTHGREGAARGLSAQTPPLVGHSITPPVS